MRKAMFASIFAFVALAGWSAEARAQATPYELNVHAGAFKWDEADDTDVMVGSRIMLQYPSGWGWGGNFDWVKAEETDGPLDLDVNLYLYSFEIDYTFPSASRAKFFVGGGVGGATIKVEDETDTYALVPVGGGIKYGNTAVNPSWAVRGDIRDNIIFGDPDTWHNLELSGGVSFFF